MEQKSNVQYRAEKEYKNSREKFFLLLREIISNSIHAVLIRQNKETNFIPQLDLNITFDENQCKIELRDNGEGFTEKNRLYFEELDKKTWKRSSLISILWAKGDWLLYTLPTPLNMKRCIRINMVHIKSEPFHIQIHLMDFLILMSL